MLYLNLDKYQADVLFGDINDIRGFLLVKLKLLEFIQSWTGNKPIKQPYVCIDNEKLYRAFMVNENACKIISFGFEFNFKTTSLNLNAANAIKTIHYKGRNGLVTAQNISDAIAILKQYEQREENLYCDLDFDDEDNISIESKRLFEYVLMQEAGYVRFDNATQGYKEWIHPLNHFDINYSNVTYKMGLYHKITIDELLAMFDKNKVKPFVLLNPDKRTILRFPIRKKSKNNKGKRRKKR